MIFLVDIDGVLLNKLQIPMMHYFAFKIKEKFDMELSWMAKLFEPANLLWSEKQSEEYIKDELKKQNIDFESFKKTLTTIQPELNMDMWNWIKENKDKHDFFIASNNPEIRINMLRKKYPEWDKVFKKIYFPKITGAYKPMPEFFGYILKDLGVNYSDVAMIDDDEKNLHTAKKLNMQGILFNSVQDLSKIK